MRKSPQQYTSKVVETLLWVVVLATGIVLVDAGVGELRDQRLLERYAIETQAIVTDIRDGEIRYAFSVPPSRVEYSYNAGFLVRRKNLWVALNPRPSMGEAVLIRYVPSNPGVNRVVGDDWYSIDKVVGLASGFGIILVVASSFVNPHIRSKARFWVLGLGVAIIVSYLYGLTGRLLNL